MKSALIFLLLFANSLFGGEEYALRIFRPSKVGERVRTSGTFLGEERTETLVNGKVSEVETTTINVEFAYDSEILEVSPEGKVMSHRLQLTEHRGTVNGTPAKQFASGDTIVIRRGGQAESTITVNGTPATEAQRELIESWGNVSPPGPTTDEETLGNPNKVKVGEQWPINTSAVVKQAEEQKMTNLKLGEIKGWVKVEGVVTEGGKPCLRVRSIVSVEGTPTRDDLKEAPTSSMNFREELEEVFPLDVSDAVIPWKKVTTTMQLAIEKDADKGRVGVRILSKDVLVRRKVRIE
jgi:hypothetical protein